MCSVKEVKKYWAIDIFFSAECNMDCEYCYIPKTAHLKTINKEIRDNIDSGKLIENILETLRGRDKDIIEIGLWGAEPTINTSYFGKFANDLFPKLENLNNLNFSSNCLLGPKPIANFLDEIEKYNVKYGKEISFDLQVSIDGPEWITDKSRHTGATKQILNTVDVLHKKYMSKEYVTPFKISFKPTISTNTMQMMVDNNKVTEWFLFFEDLQNKYKDILRPKFKFYAITTPTLVTPGFATQEDGIVLAKWLKALRELDRSKLTYYKKGHLFAQLFHRFSERVMDPEGTFKASNSTTCGGGDAAIALDHHGDMVMCHRMYSIIYNDDPNARVIRKGLSTQIGEKDSITEFLDMDRFDYLLNSYHTFNVTRYGHMDLLARQLAYSGQIDKEYLDDDELRKILVLMTDGMVCHGGSAEETTSVFIPTLSYLRVLGNGALQELILTYNIMKGVKKDG